MDVWSVDLCTLWTDIKVFGITAKKELKHERTSTMMLLANTDVSEIEAEKNIFRLLVLIYKKCVILQANRNCSDYYECGKLD